MRVETQAQIRDRHLHRILRLSISAILTDDLKQIREYLDDHWNWIKQFSDEYNTEDSKLSRTEAGL